MSGITGSINAIKSLIRFQETERLIVIPELVAVTATLNNVSPKEYVRSGSMIAECQLEARRKIGHDALFAAADLCVEAEALGCTLTFPEDNYPYVNEVVIRDFHDLARLEAPDPQSCGRMPEVLKAVRLLKSANHDVPVVAMISGPVTIASRIMDIEKMLYMIVDEPSRFRDLMEFCKDVSLSFAKAIINEGAHGIVMLDPSASPSVLPKKIFSEFVLDPVKEVFTGVKEENPEALTWYSVAGPLQTNLSIITSVRADMTTIDYMVPIETAMKHSHSTVINGNIKPHLFVEGTEEEIMENAAKLLAATRNMERFVLGSGCEVPLYSRLENIQALIKAAQREMQNFQKINDGTNMQDLHEITILPYRKKIFVPEHGNLLGAIHDAEIPITTYCNKSGSCGKCAVKIKKGKSAPPEKVEALQLQNHGNLPEERLACCIRVEGPMEVYIPYFSRVFPTNTALSEEADENAIAGELKHYGFSTNVHSVLLDDSSLDELHTTPSAGKWASTHLGPFKVGTHSMDRLKSLLDNGLTNLQAVINTKGGEVMDFSSSDRIYGLAVDIGTTTISAYLHDLGDGKLKSMGYVENPQTQWGLDIITRATRTIENPSLLPKLQANLIGGINNLIYHFRRNHSIPNDRIYDMVLVGNPVITHLFLGLSPESLSKSPFIPVVEGWHSTTAHRLPSQLRLSVNEKCRIEVLPSIKGFVGSDTVAGILACGIHDSDETSLFVDIGTNAEAVIGNRDRLLCTSVAAGPAFEGAHLSHGTLSKIGSIRKVRIFADGKIYYETVGGTAPVGICGSGFVDALADFTRLEIINRRGRFNNHNRWEQIKNKVFILVPKQETAMFSPISISENDIEEIQKAKSAVRTSIELLIKEYGAKHEDIKKVYLSGSFGTFIDTNNAKTIGMIPDLPNAEFRFITNSAGLGARLALLSQNARKTAERVASKTDHINLANHEDFNNLFIDNMLFASAAK